MDSTKVPTKFAKVIKVLGRTGTRFLPWKAVETDRYQDLEAELRRLGSSSSRTSLGLLYVTSKGQVMCLFILRKAITDS